VVDLFEPNKPDKLQNYYRAYHFASSQRRVWFCNTKTGLFRIPQQTLINYRYLY